MSTRYLTIVFYDGEYKVAQYGAFDGYPDGAGLECLHFVRDTMNEEVFKEKLSKLHKVTEAQATRIITEEDNNFRKYPQFHFDVGCEILPMIQAGQCNIVEDRLTFAANGAYCNWAYVIDLDKRTFEVYEGYSKRELTSADRFYGLRSFASGNYTCVTMVGVYPLDLLPTDEEFISDYCTNDDE